MSQSQCKLSCIKHFTGTLKNINIHNGFSLLWLSLKHERCNKFSSMKHFTLKKVSQNFQNTVFICLIQTVNIGLLKLASIKHTGCSGYLQNTEYWPKGLMGLMLAHFYNHKQGRKKQCPFCITSSFNLFFSVHPSVFFRSYLQSPIQFGAINQIILYVHILHKVIACCSRIKLGNLPLIKTYHQVLSKNLVILQLVHNEGLSISCVKQVVNFKSNYI